MAVQQLTLAVVGLLLLGPATVAALAVRAGDAIVGGSNAALLSRLQTIQTELAVSVGRIPGTAMPPEWAASGAKLGFTLQLEFTNEDANYEMTKENLLKGDALMGNQLLSVEPLNDPSFVSVGGKEFIKVEKGAYGCQIQNVASRQYALRFFVDFPEGAKRNDVELPPERIYFLSSCWLTDAYGESTLNRARGRWEKVTKSIQQINQEIEELGSKEGNVFQKALALREQFELVERRGKFNAQLADLEQSYPLDSSKVIEGPKDIIFAKEGVIAVKRLKGVGGTREQYHWVGTFGFKDFFEDEDDG